MSAEKVGAVVIVDDDKAVGMFTRRDALERVVLESKSIDSVQVSEVMTSPAEVLKHDTDLGDALKIMARRPYNHLPIVDDDEKVIGLATTKRVMKRTIERLSNDLDSMESFLLADGIGG